MSFTHLLDPANRGKLKRPRRETISVQRVTQLQFARVQIRDLEGQLKKLKEAHDTEEFKIIVLLRQRVRPERGCPGLAVKESSRRNVPWKREFVARLGILAANAVLARTEPDTYDRLVIGNGNL